MNIVKDKIVLVGGTFNPPHLAHTKLACKVKSALDADRLIMIPNNHFPVKGNCVLACAEDRLRLVELSAEGHNIEVSGIEVDKKEVSYAYNTIKYFKERYLEDEIFFVVGSDCVSRLHTWYNIDEILDICTFVVVQRVGHSLENIPKEYSSRVKVLYLDIPDISSTKVRNLIKEGNEMYSYYLDPKVYEYIDSHGLYR